MTTKTRPAATQPSSLKPAPLAYRLLTAASYYPQHRDYLLKLAGLYFYPTSDTVRVWQDQLFAALVEQGSLRRDREGLYSLTRQGEAQLGLYFERCGPVRLVKV